MTFRGKGKVWDKELKRSICSFGVTGLFHTDDQDLIKRLLDKGIDVVKEDEMVSIYECNSVNVDWKERYDIEHEHNIALRIQLREYEKKLADIEENMQIPIAVEPIEAIEEQLVDELKEENYIFGDIVLPKDYENMPLLKLKSILRDLDALQGSDYRKISKEQALMLTAEMLEAKGIA